MRWKGDFSEWNRINGSQNGVGIGILSNEDGKRDPMYGEGKGIPRNGK